MEKKTFAEAFRKKLEREREKERDSFGKMKGVDLC